MAVPPPPTHHEWLRVVKRAKLKGQLLLTQMKISKPHRQIFENVGAPIVCHFILKFINIKTDGVWKLSDVPIKNLYGSRQRIIA